MGKSTKGARSQHADMQGAREQSHLNEDMKTNTINYLERAAKVKAIQEYSCGTLK